MNCKDCGVKLVKGQNWYPSQEENRKYICNSCFQKANEETYRHQDALRKRRRSVRFREEAILLLGGKCIRCSFEDIRALCIDHINGGGRLARKSIGNSRYYETVLRQIKDGSRDYQCLCANCNVIKARERKEYGVRKHAIPPPLPKIKEFA